MSTFKTVFVNCFRFREYFCFPNPLKLNANFLAKVQNNNRIKTDKMKQRRHWYWNNHVGETVQYLPSDARGRVSCSYRKAGQPVNLVGHGNASSTVVSNT